MKLRDLLADELSSSQLKHVPSSYDLIGDLATIQIPNEIKSKEKLICKALLKLHPHLRAVLKRSSKRKGKFRLREYKLLAGKLGKPGTETIHLEHGCLFTLDLQKTYFSPREATERQRIVKQVTDSEQIMAMFAGVGPYPVQIAARKDVKIFAVELNPNAYRYLKKNVKKNKLSHKIFPIKGDVRKICPSYYGLCNRVLMPLPKGGEKFLDIAIRCLAKKGFIHYYSWAREPDLFTAAEKEMNEAAQKLRKKVKIKAKRKVLPYGPNEWKICLDAKIRCL